jgi:mRNA interferase RelE/StbE
LSSDTPWKVVWNDKVYDDLAALDKMTAGKIIERVETYLVQNPVNIGKPLSGRLAGIFRYRYGDYRILYVMDFEARTVTILGVGHRREVYQN